MSAFTRKELEFLVVVHPTGDWAEAETPEAARDTGRQLVRDARDHGAGVPTASFYARGQLVRADVGSAEL